MNKNRNNYRSHWSCDYLIKFQLKLRTHNNQNLFNESILNRLEIICREQCEFQGIELSMFNGSENQVELFLNAHPNVMPSRFVNSLKTVTSRLLRKTFPNEFKKTDSKNLIWARGYSLKTT